MQNSPVILIDAYSQIFRSFYAIRTLNNKRGEPVNAAFVFMKLLLKLEKQFPTDRGAMFFDCGKVAFRTEIAPDYKANRPPMPDDLKSQMPLIRQIAAAFGWQQHQHEGYEADDLIGGFAKNSVDSTVKIVSSDKDLSQLVDERVSMLVPHTSANGSFEERGIAEVTAKFGVAPELIVDYLALIGDSSDNIDGVSGIGPKSAADLLNSFGGSARWIDDMSILESSKYFKKLSGCAEILKRNIELITLRTTLPEALGDTEKLLIKNPVNYDELREICVDNQFNSILKELPEAVEKIPETSSPDGDELDLFGFAQQNAAPEERAEEKTASGLEQLELF